MTVSLPAQIPPETPPATTAVHEVGCPICPTPVGQVRHDRGVWTAHTRHDQAGSPALDGPATAVRWLLNLHAEQQHPASSPAAHRMALDIAARYQVNEIRGQHRPAPLQPVTGRCGWCSALLVLDGLTWFDDGGAALCPSRQAAILCDRLCSGRVPTTCCDRGLVQQPHDAIPHAPSGCVS